MATSPPADTKPRPERRRSASSTAAALTTPFRSSRPRLGEHSAVERDRAGPRRLDRLVTRRQVGEVAVVARAFQGGAEGRVDQAAGGAHEHAARFRPSAQTAARPALARRGRIDAAELAVGPEAAEGRVALLEQRPHLRASSVSVAPSTTTSQPMDSKTMAPGCRPSLNAS